MTRYEGRGDEASSEIAVGGKAIYGARLGVLMLEARFPRIPGDMGNAETWDFPVLYRVVRGASPERVVLDRAAGLLGAFQEAARELVSLGADAITTNCGFLSLYQAELAEAAGAPVATSALMQLPLVEATMPPGRRAGVLTIAPDALTPAHLTAVGARADTPIDGPPRDGAFAGAILGDAPRLDVGRSRDELAAAGRRLTAAHPEVAAIVLECTNMPPYAAAIEAATGRPVFDSVSLIRWLHAGLHPARWPR